MKIKVHCGSAHVRGSARRYPYFVASKFEEYTTSDGRKLYRNVGLVCGPYRSQAKCEREARQADGEFIDGYGSLHNQPVL